MNYLRQFVGLKSQCKCGAKVFARSLTQHKKSRTHIQKMEKIKFLESKGGQNGLVQCRLCMMYVSHKQLRSHRSGKIHSKFMSNRLSDGEKCEECQLYYEGTLASHVDDVNHRLNMGRREMYQEQCRAKKD